jgi:hypothetical protein
MSESTSEATTEATPDTGTPDTGSETVDWQVEAEKYRELAKSWEKRSKGNSEAARELKALRESSMTEQEKAVEQAREAARTETLREIGTHLVTAEFRAQAAGRLTPEQVAELVEDLDMTKYLTESGEVDAERVAKKVDALAPKPTETSAPTWPDLGQGARDSSTLALNDDGLTRALAAKVGARRP